jgi:DNA-directed RNA polymerase specialized sigma24 family protein
VLGSKRSDEFTRFCSIAEPRLRRALVAAYGWDRGVDAVQEALLYGYVHWSRVSRMENPVGFLFRVGQTRTRLRRSRALSERWSGLDPGEIAFEPRLDDLLRELSISQRTVVVLVHGYGWTHREVADLLDVAPSTVQTHLQRALTRLRVGLEVPDGR